MPQVLETVLDLPQCPHCHVDRPHLQFRARLDLSDFQGHGKCWGVYSCSRCAGVVTAYSRSLNAEVIDVFPKAAAEISNDMPERARSYLLQAIDSIKSPAGAVMLAASAVDAMLKAKELREGTLFQRINQAAEQHLITREMAQWAHAVRLDANDQRHADENAPLPSTNDAQRSIEFALALAQLMFVLPARVQRGINSTAQQTQ